MLVYLKKLVSFTFLLLLSIRSFAPIYNSLVIVTKPADEPFKKLVRAIGMVETKFDTLMYNPDEEAAGYFQIRPIRLLDYNNRTGSKYTMFDLFRYDISEKMFLYYASEIGPYDFERIAKSWNGKGKETIFYWNRVKKYL
jgi:hypothetical protein